MVSMQAVLEQTAPQSSPAAAIPGFASPARVDVSAIESEEAASDFPTKARASRYHIQRARLESAPIGQDLELPLASYGSVIAVVVCAWLAMGRLEGASGLEGTAFTLVAGNLVLALGVAAAGAVAR